MMTIMKSKPAKRPAVSRKEVTHDRIVEVAALALYLCSTEAGFITGSDYPIDGGFITLNN